MPDFNTTSYQHLGRAALAISILLLLLVVFPIWSQEASGDCGFTPASTAGPYYKSGSPERRSVLEPNIAGERIVLTGLVFDRDCKPLGGVWIDFWQADSRGRYDNAGYALRGHQYTDSSGRFRLETVLPSDYGSRPPHIHVKLRAPGGSVLTTQLYFPGEDKNLTDGIFNRELLVEWEGAGAERRAVFNFVLNAN
jgi:protocatechuate 3,4-dioxygenase beta subunit